MNNFIKILDFFWPVLWGPKSNYTDRITVDRIPTSAISDNTIDFCIKMYEYQQDRKKIIESKSIVFISFFGAIVAMLSVLIKNILLKPILEPSDYFILLSISILLIYTSKVIIHALHALSKQGYHTFSENDFLVENKVENITSIINKIKSNYDVINEKVDSMSLAQDSAKRVIYIILIAAISISIFSLYKLASFVCSTDNFYNDYKVEIFLFVNFLLFLFIYIILRNK